MTPPEILAGAIEVLAARLIAELEAAASRAARRERPMCLAVAGGSLAMAFFPRLATMSIDWTRVEIFWADERAVPPGDPASNYGVARALWITPAGVPDARVHPMFPSGREDPDDAVASYAETLARIAGSPPRLDVVLLGVGEDGHVASLFPGHAALSAAGSVAFVEDAPKAPPRRMTLTLPVLSRAELVVLSALGAGKRDAVRAALAGPNADTPAARLSRTAPRVLWLIDPAAAY